MLCKKQLCCCCVKDVDVLCNSKCIFMWFVKTFYKFCVPSTFALFRSSFDGIQTVQWDRKVVGWRVTSWAELDYWLTLHGLFSILFFFLANVITGSPCLFICLQRGSIITIHYLILVNWKIPNLFDAFFIFSVQPRRQYTIPTKTYLLPWIFHSSLLI